MMKFLSKESSIFAGHDVGKGLETRGPEETSMDGA